jgi:lipopolysaccharide/colanic/teichoic acid biosynthesis glycosyltransferase
MHAYSEYLQPYIYQKNHLKEGGKFADDFRISSWGRFLRTCWLDEFPMLVNLLKGEMKLVGVRPLSPHYFGLYAPEIQQLRIQTKPGLLPPFYVDMPITLEEVQESERRYLEQYLQHPFRTDWKYFWKIVWNIVFKRKRSE